jgi:hypothetical protein
MRVATTYGPDLNLSLPEAQKPAFDWEDLQRRANYYGPALVAFSLNAPVKEGSLWQPRGRQGLSVRTYRRSPFAPMLAYHPKEGGRVEFKSFDMPTDRSDFRRFFLMWLWLMHDADAPGRAEDQDRVYDLGAVARDGWDAEQVVPRAEEALDRAARRLPDLGVDTSPLTALSQRLEARWVPADELVRQMESLPSLPRLMHFLDCVAHPPADKNSPQTHARQNGRPENSPGSVQRHQANHR